MVNLNIASVDVIDLVDFDAAIDDERQQNDVPEVLTVRDGVLHMVGMVIYTGRFSVGDRVKVVHIARDYDAEDCCDDDIPVTAIDGGGDTRQYRLLDNEFDVGEFAGYHGGYYLDDVGTVVESPDSSFGFGVVVNFDASEDRGFDESDRTHFHVAEVELEHTETPVDGLFGEKTFISKLLA